MRCFILALALLAGLGALSVPALADPAGGGGNNSCSGSKC